MTEISRQVTPEGGMLSFFPEKKDLVIIVGPTAGGKTTIIQRVLAKLPSIQRVVTHTTRTIRDGELDGRDYHFVSKDRFIHMKQQDLFLEDNVYDAAAGDCYGSALSSYATIWKNHCTPLVIMEKNGLDQICNKIAAGTITVSPWVICIMPPSVEEGKRRLRIRCKEDTDSFAIRAAKLEAEFIEYQLMEKQHRFAGMVINDTVENAVEECISIIGNSLPLHQTLH